MFAKRQTIYKKNSLSPFIKIALELLNDSYGGYSEAEVVDLLRTTDFNEYEKNIIRQLNKDDSSEEEDDTVVINDYSLLIIQKIRFANILIKFNSKNVDISDCQVNTYDIGYINKFLEKSNGKIKKLNQSTINKIDSLNDK